MLIFPFRYIWSHILMIKDKYFLSVLVTVWCFIWIGNCIWFLSSFFPSLYCGCICWNWGCKRGRSVIYTGGAYCWTHWCYLCEVKLSIHICLMIGIEYEYMPQDWDFSIIHLDLLIFWISRSSSLPFFFSKLKHPLYIILTNTTFLSDYLYPVFLSSFCFLMLLFQAFDCVFSLLFFIFVLFWNPLI